MADVSIAAKTRLEVECVTVLPAFNYSMKHVVKVRVHLPVIPTGVNFIVLSRNLGALDPSALHVTRLS